MPPTKGEIWNQFFTINDAAGKVQHVKCKCCGKYTSPHANRMKIHITKQCQKCPEEIKVFFQKEQEDETDHNPDNPTAPQLPVTLQQPGPPLKKQRSIVQSMDIITKDEKIKLDGLFAKALLSKGLPFNTFEGLHMEAAFHALQPAYKMPSAKTFGGSLLNNEHDNVMKDTKNYIEKAKAITICSDGYTNIRFNGTMNFTVCTPKPFFLKAVKVEPGLEKKDQKFGNHYINVINKVGPSNVLLLCNDNTPVMRAELGKFVRSKFPHIYTIGCGSHSLNLLFKDIIRIEVFKRVIAAAKTIVKIRKQRQLYAIFKSKQKLHYGNKATSLIQPSSTRLSEAFFLLQSLQKNKVALEETVLTDVVAVPAEIRNTVLDNEKSGFWAVVSFLIDYIQPIVEGTHFIEADNARLSFMVAICMNIKSKVGNVKTEDSPVPIADYLKIKKAVKYRIKKFCIEDIHLACYFIDPQFAENKLSDRQFCLALKVICDIAKYLNLNTEKVTENMLNFKTKAKFYSDEIIWKSVNTSNPIIWWDAFCANQPLHPVAVRLLSLVPSATSCERIWSEYDHVHSKKRNRLKNKKVEKLVVVKHNLNLVCGTASGDKKKAELSAKRTAKYPKYKCILLDDSDDESDEVDLSEGESDPLWTSDEELETSSDENCEDEK
ncbi:uncharacterized protein LOC109856422 [Pseudomyrmex gracilis]|uniref:uncharacterized protein LOC109856422 n=1 Tax=Pseudomyrmex gracilis TaxID=219809 RepID=UPI000994FD74|nr:uncharacterized protein LOC109856422 [Pseudomyrmex gracilis]XP_020287278.1 uncharacterized protein LOC109856422 [Pseudomyrmex gracilis]XP_020287279.1 uncharacterized protein LOC109856422 [Pseudomyrmex gracilis]